MSKNLNNASGNEAMPSSPGLSCSKLSDVEQAALRIADIVQQFDVEIVYTTDDDGIHLLGKN